MMLHTYEKKEDKANKFRAILCLQTNKSYTQILKDTKHFLINYLQWSEKCIILQTLKIRYNMAYYIHNLFFSCFKIYYLFVDGLYADIWD